MISVFDKELLFQLIKDLYIAVGIRISIFDDEFNMVVEYPVEAPEACSLIRSAAEGREACRACDRAACGRAKKMRGPHIYLCHAGLTEAITPIELGGGIAGYAIFAHMLPEEEREKSIDAICANCRKYGLDEGAARAAAQQLKTYSREKIMASARLLEAIASYMQIRRLAYWRNEDICAQMERFIDANLDKDLNGNILCRHFYISRMWLHKLSVKASGKSINRYINSRRIERAKKLLEETDMPLAAIAEAVGVCSNSYFGKLFRQETGKTPAAFRKRK